MAVKDLEKFIERYPTYIEALEMLEQKDQRIAELEKQLDQLKQQLVEKEKELAYMTKQAKKFNNEAQKYYEDAYCNSFQNQKAIAELEKVNGILTDTIIEVTQNEMDLNKLCYLEEISARFYEKMQEQIKELKGE